MNLLASGVAIQILESQAIVFVVTPAVAQEALYLEPLEPDGQRERINLAPLEEAGLLRRVELEDPELELVVGLARVVDDGEAEVIAVAVNRRLPVATDDRKARRVAAEHGVTLQSTPDLVRGWWAALDPPDDTLGDVITRIRRRSRYRPPNTHALHEWWSSHLRTGDSS